MSKIFIQKNKKNNNMKCLVDYQYFFHLVICSFFKMGHYVVNEQDLIEFKSSAWAMTFF